MFVPIVQLVASRPGPIGFNADFVPTSLQFIEVFRVGAGRRSRKGLGREKGSAKKAMDKAQQDGEGQGKGDRQGYRGAVCPVHPGVGGCQKSHFAASIGTRIKSKTKQATKEPDKEATAP